MNGNDVIQRALREWETAIEEPTGEESDHRILDFIREGAGWSWVKTYQNRKFAWCGCFAAWCYAEVRLEIRKKHFPSTYRLYQWAKGTERRLKIRNAEVGDLLIVGDGKKWGDHITLAERKEAKGWWTVEGNAWGELPTGRRAEGVIRRFRPWSEIQFAYRPLPEDIEP